ncbi:M20/M25/M40 family metallo-hydrolase [Streptomyces sp. NPDC048550]|uniref:M20/M25/M40 family metallo-hydrolase n=1 Tax=Streptomyces sp. NPDC048550 TaxID=3155739 RepID=UPI00343ABCAE
MRRCGRRKACRPSTAAGRPPIRTPGPAGLQPPRRAYESSTISDPYRTPPDHPALMALTRAVSHAFGAPAGHIGNGGATPAAQLARACTAPVLFFGTGLPGDRWHGPEERVEIQALRLGVRTLARFLDELAAVR